MPIRLRRRQKIDPGLARSLAGQVAAGLARNAEPLHPVGDDQWAREMEEASIRARSALMAIGLMVKNAVDDPIVDETLALADRLTVRTS